MMDLLSDEIYTASSDFISYVVSQVSNVYDISHVRAEYPSNQHITYTRIIADFRSTMRQTVTTSDDKMSAQFPSANRPHDMIAGLLYLQE